jgi:O6-methylguanine-DNA--protein-cysteine methyltransferase
VGSNGDLTGYAAGIERKRWLLELEEKKLQENISQKK